MSYIYWTVVCYYILTFFPRFSSKSLPHFNSWDANHLPWVLGNIWGSSETNIFPCPHICRFRKIRVRFRWKHPSNIKLNFVGWEVGLMLFTTCCLQPGKIPSLYNAFFACLGSFSEINLLGVLPHCNPTSQHCLQHQWSISPWKWNIWLQFLHVDRHCILLMDFDLILVLRYVFIPLPQLYSRPLLRFTCVFTYLINCTFLTIIVYLATIYTPTGIVTYNSK